MVEILCASVGGEMIERSVSSKHPRMYKPRTPIFWWTSKWSYIKFITRELTSVFVAGYAVVLLFQLRALLHGPEAYINFSAWLKTPFSIAFHAIALLFVIFHSITWFNLAPKALVVRLGKKTLPGFLIALSNYAAWLVLSAMIAWVFTTLAR